MRLVFLFALLLSCCLVAQAQTLTTNPEFPEADEPVTFTFDVTGTAMEGYTNDVWVWTWIAEGCASSCDAPTNVNPATSAQSDALTTRDGSNPNIYTITFTPTDFFGKPKEDFIKLGLLLKGEDWSNGQTSDLFVDIFEGGLNLTINNPTQSFIFVDPAETINISATTSEEAYIKIFVDDVRVDSSAFDATNILYDHISESAGTHTVIVSASNNSSAVQKQFSYTVRSSTIEEARPVGIVDGINYDDDPTKVTLSLWAPLKGSVYVLGDFNSWNASVDYQMKKDGEHFWLEIEGLTEGQEYPLQYLVDEDVKVADPYADKILDPDDEFIPETSYPNLIEFPSEALSGEWYYNRLSVLQTGQTEYEWQVTDFRKPEKEDLVIYELLIRDMFGHDNGNYDNLIDTLSYLKNLGINTIELMPVMEFNGNNSWGYNPTFMFAPDKYYGSKNKLKEFIDAAHAEGMAVILDMVLNQNDAPAPYASLYFDYSNFKPTAENPWFNVDATHPFNVFSDFNHESSYTQAFVDTVNYYWLAEFKLDGFRFDLSKGFTQTNSGSDVGFWGQKDDSRIAILKRMADKIWNHSPGAFVILEHFADNAEEKELSDHGMMLWGNSHFDYKDAALGFGSGKSIEWAYYKTRGWDDSHVVSYMESHDEQRQMYEMINFGNSDGAYNIKEESTALNRLKLAAAFFFTVPGPKMLWQFGEFGYDVSIDENGRTGEKPTKWEYLDNHDRKKLHDVYKALIGLKLDHKEAFNEGTFAWEPDGNFKWLKVSHSSLNLYVVGNFDVVETTQTITFQETGTWYDLLSGQEIELTGTANEITFAPGQFHVFVNKAMDFPSIPLVPFLSGLSDDVTGIEEDFDREFLLYPNPSDGIFNLTALNRTGYEINVLDIYGRVLKAHTVQNNDAHLNLQDQPAGVYFLKINDGETTFLRRLIKK